MSYFGLLGFFLLPWKGFFIFGIVIGTWNRKSELGLSTSYIVFGLESFQEFVKHIGFFNDNLDLLDSSFSLFLDLIAANEIRFNCFQDYPCAINDIESRCAEGRERN